MKVVITGTSRGIGLNSAAGIWRLVEGLDRKDSGAFFDYQGNALPW